MRTSRGPASGTRRGRSRRRRTQPDHPAAQLGPATERVPEGDDHEQDDQEWRRLLRQGGRQERLGQAGAKRSPGGDEDLLDRDQETVQARREHVGGESAEYKQCGERPARGMAAHQPATARAINAGRVSATANEAADTLIACT